MTTIENRPGITKIEFTKKISMFCPLGNDYYTADITVTFVPDNIIMDYCDVDKFLNEMGGEHLIIEDAVSKIYTHISDNYKPAKLKVVIDAQSNVHFPVKVEKE